MPVDMQHIHLALLERDKDKWCLMSCQLDVQSYFLLQILKKMCSKGKSRHFPLVRCCVFFRLVASTNPPRRSRHCQHKNEPRGICVCSKSWITVTRRLPFKQLQQAQTQNYHNASQRVVINCILHSSHINTFMRFTWPNKESLQCKLYKAQNTVWICFTETSRRLFAFNVISMSAPNHARVLNKHGSFT